MFPVPSSNRSWAWKWLRLRSTVPAQGANVRSPESNRFARATQLGWAANPVSARRMPLSRTVAARVGRSEAVADRRLEPGRTARPGRRAEYHDQPALDCRRIVGPGPRQARSHPDCGEGGELLEKISSVAHGGSPSHEFRTGQVQSDPLLFAVPARPTGWRPKADRPARARTRRPACRRRRAPHYFCCCMAMLSSAISSLSGVALASGSRLATTAMANRVRSAMAGGESQSDSRAP